MGQDPREDRGSLTTLRPSENMDIYISTHSSSKITVIREQQNNFMDGGHHTMKNSIKSITALGGLKMTALEPPVKAAPAVKYHGETKHS